MGSNLHSAARQGDTSALGALIVKGYNLDERDKLQRTPLHLAAWAGHGDCVDALIAAGCNISASAQDDTLALHFAAMKGHIEVVRKLLAAGLHINAKTRKGMTALQLASQAGNKDLVQMLVKRARIDITCENKKGETAASLAPNDEVRAVLAEGDAAQKAAAEAAAQKAAERAAERVVEQEAERAAEEEAERAVEQDRAIGPDVGPGVAGAREQPAREADQAFSRPGDPTELDTPDKADAANGHEVADRQGAGRSSDAVSSKPETQQAKRQRIGPVLAHLAADDDDGDTGDS